ncbi:rolling circle replication-associated protein [Clostridium beijerinckii]|uniref:rolling circle replication-associated protein n=1 Tax=Clostridium beijerinckii TaxID=1520 RepID=UPI0015C8CBD6|nr:hypothetical protein [Clostridium beijerinckii]
MLSISRFDSGNLYLNDVAILKKFNDNCYKLSLCRSLRIKGFEDNSKKRSRGVNETKLDNNISRARSKVKEYALCNDFQYFITLTLDQKKYDRYSLDVFKKDLSKFINNYNGSHGTKVRYILIPEQHKDGAWHMHGLFSGILDKHLNLNKNGFLEWKQYTKKFGYMSLDFIRDRDKVASYITKYITKDLASSVKDLNAHMYYCSKGLNVAQEIKRGTLSANNIPYDFENDYVKIKFFDNDSIKDSINNI